MAIQNFPLKHVYKYYKGTACIHVSLLLFFSGETLASDDPSFAVPSGEEGSPPELNKKLHRKMKISVNSVKVDFQAKSNPERIDSLHAS